MWEFDPAEHQTLRELFDTTHEDVWKVLFKAAEVPPPTSEDRRLGAKRPANPVRFLFCKMCLSPACSREESKPPCQFNRTG